MKNACNWPQKVVGGNLLGALFNVGPLLPKLTFCKFTVYFSTVFGPRKY